VHEPNDADELQQQWDAWKLRVNAKQAQHEQQQQQQQQQHNQVQQTLSDAFAESKLFSKVIEKAKELKLRSEQRSAARRQQFAGVFPLEQVGLVEEEEEEAFVEGAEEEPPTCDAYGAEQGADVAEAPEEVAVAEEEEQAVAEEPEEEDPSGDALMKEELQEFEDDGLVAQMTLEQAADAIADIADPEVQDVGIDVVTIVDSEDETAGPVEAKEEQADECCGDGLDEFVAMPVV
jgi:hypothetical protein